MSLIVGWFWNSPPWRCGQPVALRPSDGEPQHRLGEPLAKPPGQDGQGAAGGVRRPTEQVLRHDVHAVPGRQQHRPAGRRTRRRRRCPSRSCPSRRRGPAGPGRRRRSGSRGRASGCRRSCPDSRARATGDPSCGRWRPRRRRTPSVSPSSVVTSQPCSSRSTPVTVLWKRRCGRAGRTLGVVGEVAGDEVRRRVVGPVRRASGSRRTRVRPLLVLVCRDSYAGERPLLLSRAHSPPGRSPFSYATTSRPTSSSAFVAARPAAPAPITATRQGGVMAQLLKTLWGSQTVGRFGATVLAPAPRFRRYVVIHHKDRE